MLLPQNLFSSWSCRLSKIILLIISILMTQFTYAANNGWQISVAPYLWAINMSGTVQVGPLRSHIDQDFSDLLKDLNWGGMLWVDANKEKVNLFANAVYSVLSKDVDQGPFSVNAKAKFGVFSAGAGYEVYRAQYFAIQPYAGLRYTVNDTTLKFGAPGLQLRGSIDQNWTDPILGARFNFDFNPAWSLLLAGDIGGTNTTDHYSYNAVGVLGYQPQSMKTTHFYLGYRLLDEHYETGRGIKYYDWNMKLYGPILGVSWTF